MDERIQAAIDRQWATLTGRIIWTAATVAAVIANCWLIASAI